MHKRTKALSIPRKVKEAVAKRDSCEGWPCCVLCGSPAPSFDLLAYSNAHYISRAQGGCGVEENILTLCPDCHKSYDGEKRAELRPFFREYLKSRYGKWDEKALVYQK